MIELFFPFLDSPILADDSSSVLVVIESKAFLRRILYDLSGEKINEVLKAYNRSSSKYLGKDDIEFIHDAMFLDVNDKKNTNLMIRQIKKMYGECLSDCTDEIKKKLEEVYSIISMDYGLEVYSDIEVKIDDILKMMNLTLSLENKPIVENLLTYIKIIRELKDSKIIVAHNLNCFLSDEELDELIHEIKLLNLILVDIENYDLLFDYDQKIFIDSSLCTL